MLFLEETLKTNKHKRKESEGMKNTTNKYELEEERAF